MNILQQVEELYRDVDQDIKVPYYVGDADGNHIFLVNGDEVKDQFEMDFVEGGNDLRWDFIPDHQVWIDAGQDRARWPHITVHELEERRRMAKGMGYQKAHEIANKIEKDAMEQTEARDPERIHRFSGQEDELVDPLTLEPPHAVREPEKLQRLIKAMRQSGWVGRPVLAVKSGELNVAMTGSHRIQAAKAAGIGVPVVWLSDEKLNTWFEQDPDNIDRFLDERGMVRIDDAQNGMIQMLREIGDRQAVGLYADELRANNMTTIESIIDEMTGAGAAGSYEGVPWKWRNPKKPTKRIKVYGKGGEMNETFGSTLRHTAASALAGASMMLSPVDANAIPKQQPKTGIQQVQQDHADIIKLAKTIYHEARGESLEGKEAVASVIWNRGHGDKNKMVKIATNPKQFSCWRRKCPMGDDLNWKQSVQLAVQMARGTFKPTTKADHYYAPAKVEPRWAKGRTGETIGGHKFLTIGKWVESIIDGLLGI